MSLSPRKALFCKSIENIIRTKQLKQENQGEKMNRIERILEDWGWVFKIILVIVWFLWAVQFWAVIKQQVKEEALYQRNRNIEQEINYIREVGKLAMEKVEAAKAAGNSYSPQQYFKDLKAINEKTKTYKIPTPIQQINELFSISYNNVRKGYFSWRDIETARDTYGIWSEQKLEELQGKAVQQLKQSGWKKVLNWFIVFYLRSMLLSLLFYLIRMVERKGILQTILADKKKFVLAIAGWIYYFFKYPNNVIKEVIVEAELRRLGGLFRKLSPKEIALVKQVANSSFYKEWLVAFRTYQPVRFQRGLIIAILGTIMLYVLCPALNASISPRKQKQLQYKGSTYGSVFLNKASPTIKTDLTKAKQNQEKIQKLCFEKWITAKGFTHVIYLPLLSWIIQEEFLLWKNQLIKKIDHIPVIDCLVSGLTKTLNQIVEGICFLRLKSGGNKNEESNIYPCGHFVGVLC